MAVKISAIVEHRVGSEAEWSLANPILLNGEVGYVRGGVNDGKFKLGDGQTPWNGLPYSVSDGRVSIAGINITPVGSPASVENLGDEFHANLLFNLPSASPSMDINISGITEDDSVITDGVGPLTAILEKIIGNIKSLFTRAPADLSNQASSYDQNASNGSLITYARSDHYHALPASPFTVIVTPSGSNDDVSINQAINSLPSSGGRILLREGSYNLSSNITILKHNVILEGMGKGTTLQGTNINVIVGSSSVRPDVVIRDINFSLGSGKIDLTYTTSFLLDNLHLNGHIVYDVGIFEDNTFNYVDISFNVRKLITNCVVNGTFYGGGGVTIRECYFNVIANETTSVITLLSHGNKVDSCFICGSMVFGANIYLYGIKYFGTNNIIVNNTFSLHRPTEATTVLDRVFIIWSAVNTGNIGWGTLVAYNNFRPTLNPAFTTNSTFAGASANQFANVLTYDGTSVVGALGSPHAMSSVSGTTSAFGFNQY